MSSSIIRIAVIFGSVYLPNIFTSVNWGQWQYFLYFHDLSLNFLVCYFFTLEQLLMSKDVHNMSIHFNCIINSYKHVHHYLISRFVHIYTKDAKKDSKTIMQHKTINSVEMYFSTNIVMQRKHITTVVSSMKQSNRLLVVWKSKFGPS